MKSLTAFSSFYVIYNISDDFSFVRLSNAMKTGSIEDSPFKAHFRQWKNQLLSVDPSELSIELRYCRYGPLRSKLERIMKRDITVQSMEKRCKKHIFKLCDFSMITLDIP
ncbi:hypothetical protein CEXT_114081 [Caerostris extrusa]|uniref:Uncharacterized protein n=1 Tax=Caerostris extrusa TaxID=172846 RepID=A0AAV4RGQ1_CAEEX|nr:hypothetical protein CEXT_114081 [Caerostris extrusa]